MPHINLLAVVVTAVASFLLGGLWYSHALFGAVWKREAGDLRKPGDGHPVKVFGVSLVCALIAAWAFAWLLPPPENVLKAIVQGGMVGAGIVAMSFGINYQFAGRSFKLLLVDGGYHTVQFAIYGLILGLWR